MEEFIESFLDGIEEEEVEEEVEEVVVVSNIFRDDKVCLELVIVAGFLL